MGLNELLTVVVAYVMGFAALLAFWGGLIFVAFWTANHFGVI